MNPFLKAVLLCLSLATICTSIRAETRKSGVIVAETWRKANGPYLIDGDILVAGLTIEPGVQVLFESNYVFEIGGTLHANGTAEEPISFASSSSTGQWEGVYFNYAGDDS